jgi:hypothetical protein
MKSIDGLFPLDVRYPVCPKGVGGIHVQRDWPTGCPAGSWPAVLMPPDISSAPNIGREPA